MRVVFEYDAISIGFENFDMETLKRPEKREIIRILKVYSDIAKHWVKDELHKYDILDNLGVHVYSVIAMPSLVTLGNIKIFIKINCKKAKLIEDIALTFLENVLIQEIELSTEENRDFVLLPVSSLRLN